MSRISIDVTEDEHKKLKAMAALGGKSIKEYVLERTLGTKRTDETALQQLAEILDERIRIARLRPAKRQSAKAIFAETARKRAA